jgi:hypothetical protein
MTSIFRTLLQIGLIFAILFGLFVAAAVVDGIPESAVRPPERLVIPDCRRPDPATGT